MSQPSGRLCIQFRKYPGIPHPVPLVDGKPILTPGYRHETSNLLRVLGLLEVGYQNLDWIVRNNYTLRLQEVSNDLLNATREMLARGEPKELSYFMDMHIRPMAVKIPHYYEVIEVLKDHPFRYNPESVKKYLGLDIPADEFTQCAPDYSSVLEYVFDNDPLAANIKIPLSGSRSVDEQRALRFLEENGRRVPTREEMDREFVLHHKSAELMVDPSGELWFTGQIIRKDVHKQTYIASLKGMTEPLPDLPRKEKDLWEMALEGLEHWEGPDDEFNYEISRMLFGHVGAVKAYTEFYPGVFYKK
jgi:hypothetical protein